jgi:glycosyltransferase involved in cell wall biosynthesis
MISALILTFNEEVNIADCIASLPWRTDVHVLDSGSTDQTVAIATQMGARVSSRAFTNYAEQRNAGLALPFQNEWIIMLDADERITADLADEIVRAIANASAETVMFRTRRKDMFMGRWLRRSSGYPTWFARVMRRGRVRVDREINEVYVANGITRELDSHLIHYPFNKGVDWWFARHNSYSTAEARLLVTGATTGPTAWIGLLARDPGIRRAALKSLAYRMPARPFLVFLYLYVIRLGFLDGRPGYQYASMRLAYEIMIDAKAASARAGGNTSDVKPSYHGSTTT